MSLNLNDFEYLHQNLNTTGLMGSDCSLANVFLLENRYSIEIFINKDFLIRSYNYSYSISGFAFPIAFSKITDEILTLYFNFVTTHSNKLCLFTNEQKLVFDTFIAENFPLYKIIWSSNPDDNDYIYSQSDLAFLTGSKYQKKRNHISKFFKTYDFFSFIYFDKTTFSTTIMSHILSVENLWLENNLNSKDLINEKNTILLALQNFQSLNLFGGLLYINEKPVAFTIANKISSDVVDIIFEKCISPFDFYGGYAVINNLFAKKLENFKFINREEDLGIEGLKKAKLSYHPTIILKKFYGHIISS